MVVLAAAICTKAGKTLFSRQFVEMTRIRIEGILAAFPKLIGGSSKQHTFVETESIRYVYQPIENLIVLLVTTKGSNIMEDLDTLRLMSKVLPALCPMVTEDSVLDNAFDIVFAFDEVITLGYKENVTEQTIRTNLEMESHEEKLQQMITASKIVEAKETADKKRQEISQARREMKSRGIKMEGIGNPNFAASGGGSDTMGGMGSSGFGASDTRDSSFNDSPSGYPGTTRTESKPKPTIGGGQKLKKGMQLKKKEKDSSFMQQMIAEDGIDSSAMKGDTGAALAAAASAPAAQRMEDVEVSMSEKFSLELTKDGGVNSLDIQGLLQVTCFKPELKLKLQLAETGSVAGYRFQTNPTINKPGFNKGKVLALKQADRAFPQDPFKLLSWRMPNPDESKVPLLINCWPQESGDGVFNVNIEYTLEADIELHDVSIKIPLNSSAVPEVISCDDGLHKFNSRYQLVEWNLQSISQENNNGILEFNIEARDEDCFFPVSTSFTSTETLCPITVSAVTNTADEPVRFVVEKSLSVDRYDVVAI